MKSLGFMLSVVVLSLSTLALAQSDAQKSFDQMKTLAGTWQGQISGTGTPMDGKTARVTLRVTSMGNALMHEISAEGRPDDPITMFYMDGDRLLLTHYCDAGNRPRMTGTMSPDGKKVEFEFLDAAGDLHYGHMHHSVISLVDANHHSEEWTFMEGDKPIHAHFDLQRVQ